MLVHSCSNPLKVSQFKNTSCFRYYILRLDLKTSKAIHHLIYLPDWIQKLIPKLGKENISHVNFTIFFFCFQAIGKACNGVQTWTGTRNGPHSNFGCQPRRVDSLLRWGLGHLIFVKQGKKFTMASKIQWSLSMMSQKEATRKLGYLLSWGFLGFSCGRVEKKMSINYIGIWNLCQVTLEKVHITNLVTLF